MSVNQPKRRRLTGAVISTKMAKTAVVRVTRRVAHPVYKKYVTKSKKYYAHDDGNICSVGDKVLLEATRPLSRLKRWRIVAVTKPAADTGVEL